MSSFLTNLKSNLIDTAWQSLHPIRRRALAHSLMPVQLADLHAISHCWTAEPLRSLEHFGIKPSGSDVEAFRQSHQFIVENINRLFAQQSYPKSYGVANSTQELIFYWILSKKPSLVVETGVANGVSTSLILAAMDHISHGKLISVDISPDAGVIVDHNHPRWTLKVTDGSNNQLSKTFQGIDNVDLFIHDGDHSYEHQEFEYNFFAHKLSINGFLMSDDINWSYAFHDFCRTRNLKPCIVSDLSNPKLFGIVQP